MTRALPDAATAARGDRSRTLLDLGVGAIVSVVYLLTLSGNHSETEDSLAFAIRVRDEPHSKFFEGAHLIFDWVGWAIYEAVRATGITRDPLRTLQVFDALVAAATVALLARILLRAGIRRPAVLVACGIVAFSYGFWRNGVDVEVYALSALTLVAALGVALHAVERPSTRSFALLGLLNGLAVLAHATNLLFGAVAIGALLLARGERPLRAVGRWLAAYAVTAAAVVVAVYATAAATLRLGSPREFWSWLTVETQGPGGYGRISPGAVKNAVVGGGRALVGAHSALAVHRIAAFVHTHFPSKPLREEAYFLRGFSTALALTLLALTVVVGLLLLALAASWLSRRTRTGLGEGAPRTLAVLCTIWLVAYGLFYTFWDPLNIELWYVFWLPAAVLLALPLALRRRPPLRLALGAALVLGLFVVNLLGSQLPQRSNADDYWRVRASWYRSHLRPDDLLISNGYIWSSYLTYLSRGHVVDVRTLFDEMPRPAAALAVRRIADRSHARHVYFSDFDFYPHPGDPQACDDGLGTCADAAALRRVVLPRSRVVARTSLERVWEYRRP